MNKIKLAIAGVLISVASFFIGSVSTPTALKGSIDYPRFNKMAVSNQAVVLTSSTLVQATTTRQYLVIVNDSSNVVYLALNGNAPAELNKGIRLNASGGAYEIMAGEANLYYGAIRAIADGGTATVTISSF